MNVYVYQASLWCETCTADDVLSVPPDRIRSAIDKERARHGIPDGASDTDNVPDGPHRDGGGDADTPQHCDCCQVFLENPLTSDGYNYVWDAIKEHNEHNETGRGDREILETWREFYNDTALRRGYIFPELDYPELDY